MTSWCRRSSPLTLSRAPVTVFSEHPAARQSGEEGWLTPQATAFSFVVPFSGRCDLEASGQERSTLCRELSLPFDTFNPLEAFVF